MKRLLSFLFGVFLIVGCEPTVTEKPVIKLDSDQSALMTISEEGGTFDVVFTSSLEWNASVFYSEGSGWINLNRKSGAGGYSVEKIKVTIAENESDKPRSAKLIISSGDVSQEIGFIQTAGSGNSEEPEPEKVFDVVEGSADVGAEGGTVKVTVRYNVEYECKIGVDWIKEINAKSYDEKVHTFIVSANETTEARSTTISFCGNGTCLPFVVNQAAGEAKPEPYLNVDTDNLSMPAEESSAEVNISSNVDWTASCSAAWVTLSSESGNGDGVLTISVAENPNTNARSANIKVADASGELSHIIQVKQQAAEEEEEEVVFELTESSAEVSAEEGTIKVIVHYNVSYECKVDVDWIKEVKAKAYDEAIHTFVVYANETTEERTGVISFCGNGTCIPFTVTQAAGEEKPYLSVSAENVTMPADGAKKKVNVSSNVDWKASCTASWVTVTPKSGNGNGELTITASANASDEIRTAVVKITDASGNLACSVQVRQQANEYEPYLDADVENISAPAEGLQKKVNISANVDWKASCTADWVKLSPASGKGDGTLTVTVSENESDEARSAVVKVASADGKLSCNITVEQEPSEEEPYLDADVENISAPAEGLQKKVNISANVDWKASCTVDWVKLSPASGKGDGTLTVTVSENVSEEARTAVVKITDASGKLSHSIPVNQDAAVVEDEPVFELLNSSAEVGADGGNFEVEVLSNIEFDYTVPVDWITVVSEQAKGSDKYICTFKVSPNAGTEERKAVITFCGNETCIPFNVTQEGAPVEYNLSVDRETISAAYTGTQTPVTVNVTSNTAWTVKSNSTWCTVTPASGNADGSFKVSVSENTSTSSRNAVVTVTSQDDTSLSCDIYVNQEAKPEEEIDDSWKTAEFEHRSLFMRFTADWCGWCPMMATSIALAQENMPGKIEALSVHGYDSDLACTASEYMVSGYNVEGFPSGLVDGRTWIGNDSSDYTASLIVNAVNDTEARYDTCTGASWTSTVSGNTVSLDLVTYMKKSGSYKVTALLVEDNIVGYQADYENGASSSYTHNGVIRAAFSNAMGDSYSLSSANQVKRFNYSVTIPSGCNKNNLKIVVYIQRADSGSYYVDNAASAKIGVDKSLAVLSDKVGGGNEGIVPGDDIIL